MYKIVFKILLVCQFYDYSQCVSIVLVEVDVLCVCQGVCLIELWWCVLELVWQSYKLLGVYDIFVVFSEIDGCCVVLLIVYCVLDFFQENGLVYCIVLFNVFVGCNNLEYSYQGQFFICCICYIVIELEQLDISWVIVVGVNSVGFVVESQIVEVVGFCGICWDQKDV